MTVRDAAEHVYSKLVPEEIAYAGDPVRGEYRGFAALHDKSDANMLLPGAEEYDASNEAHTAWLNAIMDEVSAMIIKAGIDTGKTMVAATGLLADLKARYEYPGYISVANLAFGDADGDAYRFNREDCEPVEDEAMARVRRNELPLTATPEEMAQWIRETICYLK